MSYNITNIAHNPSPYWYPPLKNWILKTGAARVAANFVKDEGKENREKVPDTVFAMPGAVRAPGDRKSAPKTVDAQGEVSLSICLCHCYPLVSCFPLSGVLDSSDILLSFPTISAGSTTDKYHTNIPLIPYYCNKKGSRGRGVLHHFPHVELHVRE